MADKAKVLFIGNHPFSATGNGNMMRAILSQIDVSTFDCTCYASAWPSPWEYNPFTQLPLPIIPARDRADDYGKQQLKNLLSTLKVDILVFIGLDIWAYAPIFNFLPELKKRHPHLKTVGLFPYDSWEVRQDWVSWFNCIDYPLVYSEYGYNMLHEYVPRLNYFRPPLFGMDLFHPYEKKKREKVRDDLFPSLPEDSFIFGFIGKNQVRKDPQTVLKAFSLLCNEFKRKNAYIYVQTDNYGLYNLKAYMGDILIPQGRVFGNLTNSAFPLEKIIDLYNSFDCLVNASMQEGLSWTLLEAMRCGVPVIASETTAQIELLQQSNISVSCNRDTLMPTITAAGESWIDSKGVKANDLAYMMNFVLTQEEDRRKEIAANYKFVDEWLAGCHNMDLFLKDVLKDIDEERLIAPPEIHSPSKSIIKGLARKEGILFVQHSSAGDVLMTTRCFKGIKEKSPSKPLIYMTQPQYQDIVKGNPYIDEIIDYDAVKIREYEIVYNPHGERILHGGFNNLDVKLADMYPYFCKVDPDLFFIDEVNPEIEIPKPYIVVHTTGGHEYRMYKHMDIALKSLRKDYTLVQIGGMDDKTLKGAQFDLRGKLTFRQSAWVMKRAKAAVVIDSFPSHLAAATLTPAVVLFGPAPARVVGPAVKTSYDVWLEPNKLDVCPSLTNCWGAIGCEAPCINTISPLVVRQKLVGILERLQ